MTKHSCTLHAAVVILCAVHSTEAKPPPTSIRLSDVTSSSGIAFQHTDGGSGEQYLFELMTAGLALFDYDGDGLVDVYFVNGAGTGSGNQSGPPTNALYRNNGNWTFDDVTQRAGVGDRGQGLGVTVGDYDNDGAPDLYVSNFGPNVLYHNNGDGTFTDVSDEAAVTSGNKFGAGVAFLDMEGDGDLDLYAANYVDFSQARHAELAPKSFPYPPSQQDYQAAADVLFRNEGDGRFTDVSVASGINSIAGPSMGMICLDYDEDGDTDVFVCNDGAANFLFQNDGAGKFHDVGLFAGISFNLRGEANGNMGVDGGDYDNDGRIDLFVTNYTGEYPVLYRNLGQGAFQDMTHVSRAGSTVFPHTNWGTGLVDFDNDGDRDLFIANGHFLKNIRDFDDRTAYRVRDTLLMNMGNTFVDVSSGCGSGMEVAESSRGVGFDDLDNDGKTDLVTLNANAPPTVLRNESEIDNHWLQIKLAGTASNRDGVGAKIRVVVEDRELVSEQYSGRGYQSYYGSFVHFGLGEMNKVDRIEVCWPSGVADVFTDLAVDRRHLVKEGSGAANAR